MKTRGSDMQCTILRWLLGIWLVETVAARHILNGEEDQSGNVGTSRNGRDQYHRQPFYNSPHFSYNSFMSSVRARRPPQVPARRNLVEQESSNDHQPQYNNHYSNYFTNDRHHRQNQQNLNVYSAVRLHGALEARAKSEPGSNTLVPTTHHTNYYHPLEEQQDFARRPADRHWRRDNPVDGESFENAEDLARFSLYNSYFDNEHSIKALNSMKCVTPTGSTGFCSTFRGCVPSFFTNDGKLQAPALAELISTSIGYCTTNVSHHYIREQREQFSREDRRFDSVANRIICCPGSAPMRDPSLDPDKIFMDYLESQRQKTSTTTAATSEVSESENLIDGAAHDAVKEPEVGGGIDGATGEESQSQQTDQQSSTSPSNPEESNDGGIVNDGESSSQDGSQFTGGAQQSSPAPVEIGSESGVSFPITEDPTMNKLESTEPSAEGPTTMQYQQESQSSSDAPSIIYPSTDNAQPSSEAPSMMYPSTDNAQPSSEAPSMMYPSTDNAQSSSDAPSTDNAQPSSEAPSMMYPSTDSAQSVPSESSQPSSDDQMHPEQQATGSEDAPLTIPPEQFVPSTEQPSIVYPSEQPQPSMDDKPAMMDPIEQSELSPEDLMMNKQEPSTSSPLPPGENAEGGDEGESSHAPSQDDDPEISTLPPATTPSTSSPSTQPPPSPGKSPDSNITKIYPEPVSGVNGKFTLPGALYIVSSSAENNYEPRPVHPPTGGETVIGSAPIIIVTNNPKPGIMMPSLEMPTFPNFPSDFPPMGSAENIVPPVDDSSLELQQRPVSAPPKIATSSPSSISSSQPPSTAAVQDAQQTQSNVETEATTSNIMPSAPGQQATESESSISMTTNEPQQDEGVGTPGGSSTQESSISSGGDVQHQQDESDMPIITTTRPQQSTVQDGASGDTTTSAPLSDDEGENDALTILPIQESASEKSGPTTEIPAESMITTLKSQPVDSMAGGDGQNQQTGGAAASGVNDITTISSASVSPQDAEATTQQSQSVANSQEDVETTTIEATTQPPNDDESEESKESSEEQRGPGLGIDDLQKTTTLIPDDENADLSRVPTTTATSQGDGQDDEILPGTTVSSVVNDGIQTHPEDTSGQPSDENVKPMMPESGHDYSTVSPPNIESSVTDAPQKIILNPGSEAVDTMIPSAPSDSASIPVQDQPENVEGSEGQISETVQPFPASSPATPGDTEQQPFPGSEQQNQEPSADQFEGAGVSNLPTATESQQPFPGSEQQQQQPSADESEGTGVSNLPTSTEPQQPFPGSEQQQSSVDQSEGAGVTNLPTAIEPQQPFPGSESDQQRPISDADSSTHASGDEQNQVDSGTEQSVQGSPSSPASETSQATNIGESAGLPTTNTPATMEQDGNGGGTQSQIDGEVTGNPGGLPSADDAASTGSESVVPGSGNESIGSVSEPSTSADDATSTGSESVVPGSGNESIGSTSESSTVPGSQTVSADGSESPSQGSGPIVPGTESSVPGSDSGNAGHTQSPISGGADSNNAGGEPIPSDPAAPGQEDEFTDGNNSASQSTSSSSQGSETFTSTPADQFPEATSSPAPEEPVVPSHDDSSSSAGDSNVSINESPVSSSTAASTAGGVTEAENISQDAISSVSPDPVEDASPVPGSSQPANNSVPADHLQDPQPIISTTESSQDVSSPTGVISSSSVAPYPGMMLPTTSSTTSSPPAVEEDDLNRFQILKACKFQNYFRSNMMEDDMDYSYRHYPWLATIVGGTRPFSSGTLITDRHILTAAHFLANITVSDVFNMRIHVGYRTSFTGNTEGPYAVRKVRKVIRHKGFSFEKLYNDIAVLVLDRPVRFSEDIYPVCISSTREAYSNGTVEAFETGWIEDPRIHHISSHHNYIDPHVQKYFSFGYKNITWRLQEASQRVRTNLECQGNYGFLEKNGIVVTDSMVCAGSGDTRSCAFRGNSGAPLFLRNEDDKMTEQVGIVSWGIGCGHFPFVFTRVESYLPWLDRVVYNSR